MRKKLFMAFLVVPIFLFKSIWWHRANSSGLICAYLCGANPGKTSLPLGTSFALCFRLSLSISHVKIFPSPHLNGWHKMENFIQWKNWKVGPENFRFLGRSLNLRISVWYLKLQIALSLTTFHLINPGLSFVRSGISYHVFVLEIERTFFVIRVIPKGRAKICPSILVLKLEISRYSHLKRAKTEH